MNADYDKNFPHAFVVGKDELEKLVSLFLNSIGEVRIKATCVDDVNRSFASLNDLLAYENPKSKRIQRLTLSAHSSDLRNRASITLSNSGWRGTSLQIDAPDDILTPLRDKVLDIIDGMKPWYSLLSRTDFVLMTLIMYILLWLGSLALIGFGIIPVQESQEENPVKSALYQLIFYGGIAVVVLMNVWMYRFRDSVFPRGVFLIGQGIRRFEVLDKVQWGIVIAFVVSLAAGVPLLAL